MHNENKRENVQTNKNDKYVQHNYFKCKHPQTIVVFWNENENENDNEIPAQNFHLANGIFGNTMLKQYRPCVPICRRDPLDLQKINTHGVENV